MTNGKRLKIRVQDNEYIFKELESPTATGIRYYQTEGRHPKMLSYHWDKKEGFFDGEAVKDKDVKIIEILKDSLD